MTEQRSIAVALPDEGTLNRLSPAPDGVEFVVWTPDDAPLGHPIDLLVLPYMGSTASLPRLAESTVAVVQSQSLGYDGVQQLLPPGITYCNAVGVHEGPTAELALALILSAQRGLREAAIAQESGSWQHENYPGLAGRSVLLIGVGGVGREIEMRLRPFDVTISRMARTARVDERGAILAMSSLDEALPVAEIVVIAVPLSTDTRHLVSAEFLARMRPGALLVNVSRGAIVDTDALVERLEKGSVRAALDVTDPEPLPSDHPLWHAPGVVITPHVGGHVQTMPTRIDPLIRDQIHRLQNGLPPINIVIGP
ncbi:MAG: hydroxyacid dehydrogenase [Microbacteriaceae bacterium]|nr:hydroxyacid dehydrogenase [Microbacteriaceae bacterium]